MNGLFGLIVKFPLICAGAIFIVVGIPINYLFLGDKPNNALEQAEEAVIKQITGIDVDLNPQD